MQRTIDLLEESAHVFVPSCRYYFVEGYSLNDRPRLAKEVSKLLSGLVKEKQPTEKDILDFLNSTEGRKEILEAYDTLHQMGIHGIPKFIIEGQTLVDGAARDDVFVRIFRDIESRGKIHGGPVFGSILGVSDEVVNRGSHLIPVEEAA